MVFAVILLPALIAMAMLNSAPAEKVAARVYLPCLFLVPIYITKGLGGFLISDTTLTLFLLAGVGILRWHSSIRFTFLDLCVCLFAFSAFYADAHVHALNVAFYSFLQNVASCFLPYWVARTLIEQTGSRKEFAKSLVFCLAIVGFLSLYEYKMERNLFDEMVGKITGQDSAWGRQTRWGFARIAGPYGHAITAGMMFSTGVLLQLWLFGTKSWDSSKALRYFRTSRRGKVITWAVCLGLFMTQSRGPWIGFSFGLIIASIGFAKDRRRAATFAIIGLIVAVSVTSVVLSKYTSEHAYTGSGDDLDQQNAAYRANLLNVYGPLVAQGGFWGWGSPTVVFRGVYGWVAGQTSIDNEYILLAMQQGYFGVGLLILMLAAAIYRMIRLCATLRNRQDILFAYCLLGSLLALAFSISTVALQDPMIQVAFLMLGWTQSVRPTGNENEALAPANVTSRFQFKRVFA